MRKRIAREKGDSRCRLLSSSWDPCEQAQEETRFVVMAASLPLVGPDEVKALRAW